MSRSKLFGVVLAGVVTAGVVAGCDGSSGSAAGGSTGRLVVAAAENFWGSIASQLGGSKVSVQSIIVNPNTDPHSYEPTAADGAALARSQMAIVNGIGYDRWASQLIDANPSSSRVVLNVGSLLGLSEGDNPHQWYSPSSAQRVIDQIVAEYKRLDPNDSAYFDRERTVFETRSLAAYKSVIAAISARYAGVPVGYSESIFQPLGEALGLKLMTPYSFAKAIAEGPDVSAADKQTVDSQVHSHEIKVWVYNSQNATPDVQRVNQLARADHIPITTITETLSPASDSFVAMAGRGAPEPRKGASPGDRQMSATPTTAASQANRSSVAAAEGAVRGSGPVVALEGAGARGRRPGDLERRDAGDRRWRVHSDSRPERVG